MTDKTKIIGICYMVFGALGLLGLPLIYVHQMLMEAMISSLGQTDPAAMEVMQLIQDLMEIMVPLLIVLVFAHIVFNVLVGFCFIKHRAYYTCMISSILTCFVFPVGTILGVFSLMALSDEKIKAMFYQRKKTALQKK